MSEDAAGSVAGCGSGARSLSETVCSRPDFSRTWAYDGVTCIKSTSSHRGSYFEARTCFFRSVGPLSLIQQLRRECVSSGCSSLEPKQPLMRGLVGRHTNQGSNAVKSNMNNLFPLVRFEAS